MSSDASTPLFSADLISAEVVAQLPEGYNCRPIQKDDYHNGFLDVLRVLTTVGDVTEEVGCPSPSIHHTISPTFNPIITIHLSPYTPNR